MRLAVALTLTFTLGLASPVVACRYTVRDIGFVDLTGPSYTLHMIDATAEEMDAAEHVLAGSNVRAEAVAAGTLDLGHGSGYVLANDSGGKLAVESIEAAVESPLRARIRATALDAFVFVVVFDGADDDNAAVVRDARAIFESYVPQLPRPIAQAFEVVHVQFEARDHEAVLAWSMGIDSARDDPAIVVLYGRGKRAGPVLVGETLTARELAFQLALVGESCECETDRNWLDEPAVPMRWSGEGAVNALGFDPRSPLVKAEVVRIIGRGIRPGSTESRAGRDTLEAMLLGYRETVLPADSVNESESAGAIPEEPAGEAAIERIVVQSAVAIAVLAFIGGLVAFLVRSRGA